MKNRIRFFRQQKGLTQASLARRLDTTAATVSRLETNDIRISADWLKALSDTLGVSVADLIGDSAQRQIPVAGSLDAHGCFSPASASNLRFLPHIYGNVETIAVRMAADLGPYRRDEVIVADRTSSETYAPAVGKDCLLQEEDGDILLVRFLNDQNTDQLGYTAVELQQGGRILHLPRLLWVAPVKLVFREV